jgi:exodeoxyribonuclease V alpha subunit
LVGVRACGLLHGPNGVGKTLLVQHFLALLPDKRYKPLVLSHSSVTGTDLLRLLCTELGQTPRMRRSDNILLIRQGWQQLERLWPIVVLDEAQNLSATALEEVRLLTCDRRDTQPPFSLLLVGDPYQLPPIGFGLVFQVLAASPRIPKVELVEVHRQAQSSGIPQIARDIRHGVVPSLPAFADREAGVRFLEAGDGDIMDHILGVLAEWRGREDTQVLGVTKRGISGTRNINRTLHAMTSASKPKLEGWGLAEGDPIIYLVNDYRKELWNGSLGRIESILDSDGRRALLCALDGAWHEIPEEDFQRLDLAYAITVHKAQGSQFKRVIVPIGKTRLLDRTLIYTALTRGMEQVVFVGDRGAFDAAVTAPPRSHERQVGFSI